MKLFTLLFAFLLPLCLFAQVQKGGHFLNGGLSLSSGAAKTDDAYNTNKSSGFTISPSIGYDRMLTNRWSIGGGISFTTGRNTYTVSQVNASEMLELRYKSRGLGFDLRGRRFYPLGESGKWMASMLIYASLGQSGGSVDTVRASGISNRRLEGSKSVNVGVSPSIVYAFSKHFMAQAFLGNLSYSYSDSPQSKRTNFNLSIYPSWGSVGFLYYWEKLQK